MRNVMIVVAGLVAGMMAAAVPATAQVTRADTASVLYRVALDLRDAGEARDARRLLQLIVDRYGGTPSAQDASTLLLQLVVVLEQGAGTAEFVSWHTALGAAVGLLIPAALDAEEPEAFGVGLLLGGPLGYGLSRAYSSRRGLSSGQALAIDYASAWGMIQFPMWENILDIGATTVCFDQGPGQGEFCFDDGGDGSTAGVLVGALTGVAAGIAVAGSRPVTTGTALSVVFASQWGLYFGFVGSTLAQAEDEGPVAWAAIGGNVGFLAAALGAPRLGWSPSRTWLVQASGIAGLAAGFGVALIVNPSDDEAAWALTAIGAGIGLGVGAASTRDMDGGSTSGIGLSLLERRDDQWRLGVPLPRPGIVPAPAGGGRAFVPAAKLSLLRAVF